MLAFTSPPIENHPANGGGHKHADWIDFIGQGGDNRDGGMYIHTQCTRVYRREDLAARPWLVSVVLMET